MSAPVPASGAAVAAEGGAEVVVVGASNTDLTAYVPRLPVCGETILGTKFQTGFGGKGANQCVMAAKLGARCCMVTKLGQDSFGADTRANYARFNIMQDYIFTTTEAATGVAPIAVDSQGRNSIIVVKGANDLLSVAEIESARGTLQGAKVVVCQLEIKPETSLVALRIAKEAGVITIFNPAPAQPALDPGYYPLSDIFCANETEAAILTGIEVTSIESARAASEVLLSRGCGHVLLTLGAQGAWLHDAHQAVHVPARVVAAVDTSGAGDAFIGALAFFLARGGMEKAGEGKLREMVRRAGEISTMTVLHEGTQSSFPDSSHVAPELLAWP